MMRSPGARLRAVQLAFVLKLAGGLVVAGPPAYACSCAEMDLSTRLPEADGAFIGTFVDRERIDEHRVAITFQVERVIKGEFGPRAIVRTDADGASCGLEFYDPQTAMLLDLASDGVWESSLCQQVQPGDLLAVGGDRPPDPDLAPVSAGWTLGFKGLFGAFAAAAVALLVLLVIRWRASRSRQSDVA